MSQNPEEESVLEVGAAPAPFLKITARYPASFDTGRPEEIMVELNVDEAEGRPDPDGTEPGFIRFTNETISTLLGRSAELVQIEFSPHAVELSPEVHEGLVRQAELQQRVGREARERIRAGDARLARERTYGRRGLPPEVIDRVLVDPPKFATGGPLPTGFGATADLPYAGGGCRTEQKTRAPKDGE